MPHFKPFSNCRINLSHQLGREERGFALLGECAATSGLISRFSVDKHGPIPAKMFSGTQPKAFCIFAAAFPAIPASVPRHPA